MFKIQEFNQRKKKYKKLERVDEKIQIAPFINKLFNIIQSKKNQSMINWSQNGDTFIIINQAQFQIELLPSNFKHNNFVSFVRQLNMYNFKKLRNHKQEFYHPFFNRDNPDLIQIQRQNENHHPPKNQEKIQYKLDEQQQQIQNLKNTISNQQTLITDIKQNIIDINSENQSIWRQLMLGQDKLEKKIENFEYIILSLLNPNYLNYLNTDKKIPLKNSDNSYEDKKIPLKNSDNSFEEKNPIQNLFENKNFFSNLIELIEKNRQNKNIDIKNCLEYPQIKKVKTLQDDKSETSDYFVQNRIERVSNDLMIADKPFNSFQLSSPFSKEKSDDEYLNQKNMMLNDSGLFNDFEQFN